MKAIDIFRKNGYRQRYNDRNTMIYDLIEKEKDSTLPDTILFSKGIKNVSKISFSTDNPEKYIHLGTYSCNITNEILQAISKQIQEIEEK